VAAIEGTLWNLVLVLGDNALESDIGDTMKRNQIVAVTTVLGAVLLVAFPKRLGGQAGGTQSQASSPVTSPNERDVAAMKQALINDATDLEGMAKSLGGTELSSVLAIDEKAHEGVMEMDASLWFLSIYDSMQCDKDREIAKTALKNRLGFYSYVLGIEADSAAGPLPFMSLPATVQSSVRVKDDLRAAKNKLDEIAGSLK
jgi:hypothetical protein